MLNAKLENPIDGTSCQEGIFIRIVTLGKHKIWIT